MTFVVMAIVPFAPVYRPLQLDNNGTNIFNTNKIHTVVNIELTSYNKLTRMFESIYF